MAGDALVSRSRAHQRYRNSAGEIVPGVTTITGLLAKPFLIPWANRMGLQGIDTTKYVDAAARVGTLAHEMAQHHLGAEEPDWNQYTPAERDLAENSFLSFLEWAKEHVLETRMIEEQLVSDTWGYGGSVDWYGLLDGKWTLLDLKTGKAIYDDYLFQVSAYALALQENGHPVDSVRILNIPRTEDEKFAEKVFTMRQVDMAFRGVFLPLLEVYKTKKELGMK